MVLIEDTQIRILIGLIIESFVFIVCLIATGIIIYRHKRNKKPQLRNMVIFYICYSVAIAASVFGKILDYLFDSVYLGNTEWGIFTNWSVSLGFISLSLYYQLEAAWALFPPKLKHASKYARIGSIILFMIVFILPRHDINGVEIPLIYPIKFILVFIYVLAASLYNMYKSYKVFTFIRTKFLQRRILAGLVMNTCIIMVFVFFMISSIYGTITSIFYTWGYFISISFMLGAAISAFFYVKQGKESDRQEIDDELKKLS